MMTFFSKPSSIQGDMLLFEYFTRGDVAIIFLKNYFNLGKKWEVVCAN